eukprot:1430076-Pyramimonas_sp.AAC.1
MLHSTLRMVTCGCSSCRGPCEIPISLRPLRGSRELSWAIRTVRMSSREPLSYIADRSWPLTCQAHRIM